MLIKGIQEKKRVTWTKMRKGNEGEAKTWRQKKKPHPCHTE